MHAAAVWWNLDAQGVPDPLTLHAGCPVLGGVKYGMNMWFRERSRKEPPASNGGPAGAAAAAAAVELA